jgi:hypothetical protein
VTDNVVTWLSRWERSALIAFFLALVGFGVVVEVRTAFLSRKMGDLDCYLRPAWAIRKGLDLYEIKDDCGWHYNYPPMFAILMMPLADPPAGADRSGMLPFALSAAIWYLASVGFIALGVHWLAGALEKTSANPAVRSHPWGCRRWWALRMIPVLVCLPPMGHSLMRGQVNPLVLLLLCGMIAATIRGQGLRSGLCLAGMICIKVYPAFLLLYPVWRRDRRCLAGCALGLFLGLVAVPTMVFGVPRTWDYYQEYYQVTLAPALGMGADQSRAVELIDVPATDSQSFLAVFHNSLHPDRNTRPRQASLAVRAASFAAGGLMTLITLLAVYRRRTDAGPTAVLFPSALMVVMLLLSPVCHLHYFAFLAPLVMGLIDARWQRRDGERLGLGLVILFSVNVIVNALPNFPIMSLSRDFGLATSGTLLLWLAAIWTIRKHQPQTIPLPTQLGDIGEQRLCA